MSINFESKLTAPPRRKRRIGHNLALRFKALKTAVLLFLNDLTMPFTNNEAERDLRMMNAQFLNRRYVPNFRYNRGQIRERL